MTGNDKARGDRAIRVSTAATVIGIAGVAAVVSYRHAFEVVRAHGETGTTSALVPLCVDGLVFAAGMVLLDSARRGQSAPGLARCALALGIGATVAVNVLHGIQHGPVGAVIAAWPAVTLVVVVELLMGLIRRGRVAPGDATSEGDTSRDIGTDVDHETADTSRDIGHDTGGDTGTATPDTARAAVSRRTSRATRRATRDADEDRMARAREVLAEVPDISGAELGRRLGLSPRQGQRLLSDVRSSDPLPAGQPTTDDNAHDTDDVVRLSVVGGER